MKPRIFSIALTFILFASLLGASNRVNADAEITAGVPTIVSYQGQVMIDGQPYTGTGYFKFAIVNQVGLSFWSNDGTYRGEGMPPPEASLSLSVNGGLFSVLLGDTPQYPLTAWVFTELDRFLRVWFGTDGSTFTQLAPDQRFASVPFALQAQEAGNAATFNYQPSTYYLNAANMSSGMLSTDRFSAYEDLLAEGYLDNSDPNDVALQSQVYNGIPNQFLGMATISAPDSASNTGNWTSITIGTDGLGLISYRDSDVGSLKVLHCADMACSSGSAYTLDTDGDIGSYSSITIGVDGFGLISYFDSTQGDLKVFHCADVACSTGSYSSLDTAGYVGQFTSITIGTDGLGLISYRDDSHASLKVFHCANVACSSGSATTLDAAVGVNVGYDTSITIGTDGLGLISYYDSSNTDLKVFHCANVTCSSGTITPLDTANTVGSHTSVTIGMDGLGLISYYDLLNDNLKVFHCGNLACSSGSAYMLDFAGDVGQYTSITMGADGLGLISYYDSTNSHLKVFRCANTACSSGLAYTLDGASSTGFYSSITTGPDGLGLISYQDFANHDLKVAKLQGIKRR